MHLVKRRTWKEVKPEVLTYPWNTELRWTDWVMIKFFFGQYSRHIMLNAENFKAMLWFIEKFWPFNWKFSVTNGLPSAKLIVETGA